MPSKVGGQAGETVWTGAVGGTGRTVNAVGSVGTRGVGTWALRGTVWVYIVVVQVVLE